MDTLEILQSIGIPIPSPAYIVGAVIFGIVGLWAWRHGKRASFRRVKWTGVALMFYPYLVSETWLLYCVGLSLCFGLGADLYMQHRKGLAIGPNSPPET